MFKSDIYLVLAVIELRQGKITCECVFPDELPPARMDARQLAKAFHNLMRNAAQAMPTGGTLSIAVDLEREEEGDTETTASENAWISVTFSDNGTGIAAEQLDRIFNPFFTTKDTGTGLGLSITHKVIVEHGGRIEVSSRMGEGTRFSVKLPLETSMVERP